MREESIVLNGAQGTLSVFAFDLSVSALESALPSPLPHGVYLLPCGAAEAGQCLAFALESDKPGAPEWPWSDLPPAGGFEPSFSALLNDGRTGFAGGDTALSPDAARAAWSSHLAANGWAAASPAADSTSLSLYVKGRETLALTVLALPDGTSRVSLLRRVPR